MKASEFNLKLYKLIEKSPELVLKYINQNIFEDYSEFKQLYPEFYDLIKNRITFKDICCGIGCFLGLRMDGTLLMNDDENCKTKYKWVGECPKVGTFIQISSSDGHFAALREDGVIFVWGDNHDNQINNVPTGIFKEIRCGFNHTTALRDDGTVVTWGSNDQNQLNGQPNGKFTKIKCGYHTSVGFKEDGSIVIWGNNCYGQIDNCPSLISTRMYDKSNTFLNVLNNENLKPKSRRFVDVACGMYFLVALREDGTVYTWGYSIHDNLHDLNQTSYYAGKRDNYPEGNFKKVCSDFSHSAAIRNDGKIIMWGENVNVFNIPVGNFKDIYIYGELTVAIHYDGSIYKFDGYKEEHHSGDFIKVAGCKIAMRSDGTIYSI